MAEIVRMPKLGFDMAEGVLVHWVKKAGETVAKGDVLAEIETDKATVEVESAFDGVVAKQLVEEGAIVPVGEPIAVIAQPGEEVNNLESAPAEPAGKIEKTAAAESQTAPQVAPPAAAVGRGGRIFASPIARRLAAQAELDLTRVQGSGPGGRVVRRDVESALKAPGVMEAQPPAPRSVPAPAERTPVPVSAQDEIVPMERLRQIIGRRMLESKQQIPHFYVTHEYDLEALTAVRSELNQYLPEEEKLSINDFIVKAVGMTLRRMPELNTSLDGDKILRHGAVNVGVAVAVEGGLLTVVVHDADSRPLREISKDVKIMAGRVRSGKVRPEDIEGSTFSISNLGMFDVENFAAIINPPEAGILAVGSAKPTAAVVDGAVQVRTRVKMTISADHRLVDGVQAAQFMKALADILEKPLKMLI